MLFNNIKKYLKSIHVTKEVFIGAVNRLWTLLSGPITIIFVLNYFSEITQGYFYTFKQLLALRVLTELGLGTVIIQFVSHEWAHLSVTKNGNITGKIEAKNRLASIIKFSFKWFFRASALLFIILLIIGMYLFGSKSDPTINWFWPWFFLAALTSFELLLIPGFSILTGCNDVFFVYSVQLLKAIINIIFIWLTIALGLGIWSLVIGSGISIIISTIILGYFKADLIKKMIRVKINDNFEWKTEIWPMQWRIALSWLCGYFTYNLFTPVLFHFQGPEAAGQMGMTMSVISVIGFVPSLWIKPNMPQFGIHIAKKNYFELDKHFFKLLKVVLVFLLFTAFILWIGFYIINVYNFSFAARLLPLLPITLLIIAKTLSSSTSPFSDYLRAHKKEPFVIISVISSLLIAGSNIYFGSKFGAYEMVLGYLFIIIILTPISFTIWFTLRKKWHSAPYLHP